MHEFDETTLRRLEETLWKSETRFDLAYQERIFAPDFFEFGRSGRRYKREQMIRGEGTPIDARLPLTEFRITWIDGETALITYVSEVMYETLERANRSSIWSRTPNGVEGWQLRFHQGTPC